LPNCTSFAINIVDQSLSTSLSPVLHSALPIPVSAPSKCPPQKAQYPPFSPFCYYQLNQQLHLHYLSLHLVMPFLFPPTSTPFLSSSRVFPFSQARRLRRLPAIEPDVYDRQCNESESVLNKSSVEPREENWGHANNSSRRYYTVSVTVSSFQIHSYHNQGMTHSLSRAKRNLSLS